MEKQRPTLLGYTLLIRVNLHLFSGLETLEKSISFWEESLHMLKSDIDESFTEEDRDCHERSSRQLEKILDAAYTLQRLSEELYLDEVSEYTFKF
jgi:hypothetical protein